MGLFGSVGKAVASFFGGPVRTTPIGKPAGGDGVQSYGGVLQSPERNPKLIGSLKWVEYSNATNTAIVATGLRYSGGLLAGTTWHAEPNPRGGSDADRGVEIVEQGLLQATLPKPWPNIVRKQALYKHFGFALHEWCAAPRRADGMVVFTDIAHRPQHTIDRWDKPSEQEPWKAVGQLTQAGNRWTIPRGRLFYSVDDTLTDSPEGVGLFRHIVELVRRLGVLEGLEGLAYETDLRGMPVGRAPFKDLMQQAEAAVGNDKAKMEAFVAERTQKLRDVITSYAKTPDKLMYLLLDSATYTGADPNTITSIQKWGLDLMRGEAYGVAEVAAAIGRIQLEIARVLGIEFAMVGGGDTAGTYGMHADKTGMFGTFLQTTLTEVAAAAERDLAWPLVALNGLDPETCTPRLVAEPISTESVETVCRALQALASAGLAPDDEAIPVIRKRLRLPPPPEPTPEQMGMLGAGGPPDPAIGEEDVDVGDLGEETVAGADDEDLSDEDLAEMEEDDEDDDDTEWDLDEDE